MTTTTRAHARRAGVVTSPHLTPSDASHSVPRTLEGTADHVTQVRAQAAIVASARAELERRVVAARAEGVALRKIADAAGVSHEEVRRIVARADA